MIVLIDSAIKIWGYRRSCWVTFEKFEILRFLGGPYGGFPQKNLIFFSPKFVKPHNNKSQILKKHVSYAKISVISDIGQGGWIPPPPGTNREHLYIMFTKIQISNSKNVRGVRKMDLMY